MSERSAACPRTILLTGFAVAFGCANAISPFDVQDELQRVVVDFGGDVNRWPRDPVTIRSGRIEGDVLSLAVQYGGGCADHDFGLVASDGWLESHPVQAGLVVVHDAHGDLCRALINNTLRFNLTPLREEYRNTYHAEHGAIVLRFRQPVFSSLPPLLIRWDF